jgi:hypothetical protein
VDDIDQRRACTSVTRLHHRRRLPIESGGEHVRNAPDALPVEIEIAHLVEVSAERCVPQPEIGRQNGEGPVDVPEEGSLEREPDEPGSVRPRRRLRPQPGSWVASASLISRRARFGKAPWRARIRPCGVSADIPS